MQVRLFMIQLVEARIDIQGRLTVPEPLRAEVGLGREVTVCGVGPRIELWPAGRYEMAALDRDTSVSNALSRAGF